VPLLLIAFAVAAVLLLRRRRRRRRAASMRRSRLREGTDGIGGAAVPDLSPASVTPPSTGSKTRGGYLMLHAAGEEAWAAPASPQPEAPGVSGKGPALIELV